LKLENYRWQDKNKWGRVSLHTSLRYWKE
jgi:hypothetical protein